MLEPTETESRETLDWAAEVFRKLYDWPIPIRIGCTARPTTPKLAGRRGSGRP